jgi:pyruvate/2-oxoglutarate dehydrogenase complex dihydrolipoamide dehydrogenase (E3) component
VTATIDAAPRLLPDDVHNRALLDHVHPPTWENPVAADRYQLVVVGGGTAGLVSAAIAAGLGAKVALIERHLLGGDCLNVGCVPSKALLRASRAWHQARSASAEFGGPDVSGEGDFAAVMERLREVRAGIAPVDGAPRYRDLGVDVFLGDAEFTGRDTVAVAGQTLRFRRAIVATGARASLPPIPGLAEAEPLTNESLFSLTSLPERLTIIGAGPIGLEMAQSFARFGSHVTVFNGDARAMPRDDADAAAVIDAQLRADGVVFHHSARISKVERTSSGTTVEAEVDGRTVRVEGDELLVAAGRAPNTDGLGLEAAGVTYTKRGVQVDERFRTSNPNVYAIGDVSSRYQFTHAADAQARLVIPNALFFGIGGGKASSLLIPWATYTSPEVAHVGQTAADLEQSGTAFDTISLPMADNDRGILEGDTDGFFKVLLAKGTDRMLGATLVSEHAGDMIGEVAAAMQRGDGLRALGKTIHPYPTRAAIFGRAADHFNRGRLTPFAKRIFASFFKATT